MKKTNLKQVEKNQLLRLDLGCGKNKRDGFIGVDARQFDDKVDQVVNLVERHDSNAVTCAGMSNCGLGCVDKKSCKVKAAYPFKLWPWDDNSVEEVHCSHFIEHLTAQERIHFVNELYRVLISGGKATVITPHWASNRAYGDLTHQWPPVAEMWFYYLDKNWRASNAPHNDFYRCDFACTWGYALHQEIQMRSQESQAFAMQFYKEAAQDIICSMTARK